MQSPATRSIVAMDAGSTTPSSEAPYTRDQDQRLYAARTRPARSSRSSRRSCASSVAGAIAATPAQRELRRVGLRELPGEEHGLPSLGVPPDRAARSGARLLEPARRADRVEDRATFALADEIRVRARRAQAGIVRRRDDIVEGEERRKVRDRLEESLEVRGRAGVGDPGRRMRPGDDRPAGEGRGRVRRDDDSGDGDRLAFEPGRNVEHFPRRGAGRRSLQRLGAEDVPRPSRMAASRGRIEGVRRRRRAPAAKGHDREQRERPAELHVAFSLTQQLLEPRVPLAAHRHARAVREDRDVAAPRVRLEPSQDVEADQV